MPKAKRKTPAPKKTRKFDGKNYRHKGNYKLKSKATSSAKSSRNAGKKARVVKKKGGYCVYTRG